MTRVLEKLSLYDILNYLFPGLVFSALLEKFTVFSLVSNNLLMDIAMACFVGIVLSRIGSILVEPVIDRYCESVDYKLYCRVREKDAEISVLRDKYCMYRTIIGMLLCLGILRGISVYNFCCLVLDWIFVLDVALILLFFCSYKKQVKYFVSRVNSFAEKTKTTS